MTILRRFHDIQGWELGARDGNIGRCHDLLFEDTDWAARYLVADTRKWLPGRKVLIPPRAVESLEESSGPVLLSAGTMVLSLTKEQIKNAPPLDSDAPVSRRYETAFNRYYDWPNYWAAPSIRDPQLYPTLLHRPEELTRRSDVQYRFSDRRPEEETHLRSAREVASYRCLAGGQNIGDVDDFLVEEESWIIRYLIVDARKYLPEGRWLLISTDWVAMIDWADSSIAVTLTTDQLAKGPRFDPDMELDRHYERAIHEFYGLPYYWRNGEKR